MKSPLQIAIDLNGGLNAFAGMLNVAPQTLSNWRARGVPAERCPDVEAATGGVVTCEVLRPDIRWCVLRKTCSEA